MADPTAGVVSYFGVNLQAAAAFTVFNGVTAAQDSIGLLSQGIYQSPLTVGGPGELSKIEGMFDPGNLNWWYT